MHVLSGPHMHNAKQIKEKRDIDSYNTAAQYEQDPVPLGGS